MFGLKKSNIKSSEYNIFDIPNQEKFKIAVYKNGGYVCVAVLDDNDVWYRLGDRMDLVPDCLKDVSTSYRGYSISEQQEFIDKILTKL